MTILFFFHNLMQALMSRTKRDEFGGNLIEYCLLVGLIAMVCVGAITFFGEQVPPPYETLGSGLEE